MVFVLFLSVLALAYLFYWFRKKPIYIDEITSKDFQTLRKYLETKSQVLMDHEKRGWAIMGVDISKFGLVRINSRKFFIISSGNVFKYLLDDTLPEACVAFPNNFGQNRTDQVFEALYNLEPVGELQEFPDFLKHEKFAWIVELKDNKVLDRVLRIELFRQDKKTEFVGGLFHAFNHFSYKDVSLSTRKANFNLAHPHNILFFIVKSFFIENLAIDSSKFSGTIYFSEVNYTSQHKLRFYYFHEPKTDIYFLTTAYATNATNTI